MLVPSGGRQSSCNIHTCLPCTVKRAGHLFQSSLGLPTTSSREVPPRVFSTLPTLKQTLTPPLLSPDSHTKAIRPPLDVDSRSLAVPWTLGVVAATAVCNSPGMISVHYSGPFLCPDLIFQASYLHVLSCSYVAALSHTNSFSSAIVRP